MIFWYNFYCTVLRDPRAIPKEKRTKKEKRGVGGSGNMWAVRRPTRSRGSCSASGQSSQMRNQDTTGQPLNGSPAHQQGQHLWKKKLPLLTHYYSSIVHAPNWAVWTAAMTTALPSKLWMTHCYNTSSADIVNVVEVPWSKAVGP